MSFIFSFILFASQTFAINLKSYKPPENLATKNVDSITCDFMGKLESNNKMVKLKSEVFKAKDLSVIHEDGNKGVYVNMFDFLGFTFYLDSKKVLHIKTEIEEVQKKELRTFRRLPASIKANVDFSVTYKKKYIILNEVTLVCKP